LEHSSRRWTVTVTKEPLPSGKISWAVRYTDPSGASQETAISDPRASQAIRHRDQRRHEPRHLHRPRSRQDLARRATPSESWPRRTFARPRDPGTRGRPETTSCRGPGKRDRLHPQSRRAAWLAEQRPVSRRTAGRCFPAEQGGPEGGSPVRFAPFGVVVPCLDDRSSTSPSPRRGRYTRRFQGRAWTPHVGPQNPLIGGRYEG
jgi:hypothetical protein